MSAAHPTEVSAFIESLLKGVREALGDNLLGAYLAGSIALGGFDRATSDVDMLVVTKEAISEPELAVLKEFHFRLPPSENEFGMEYDVYYLDRETVCRFVPGQRHVKVGTDEPLHRAEHRPIGVLERWTVRERGITLLGPDPKTLIEPISRQDIRAAAAGELLLRLQHWSDGTWPLSELAHRGSQGYEVETTCRALQTMDTGRVSTKADAIARALENLPEEWRPLIEWSQTVRKDRTADESRIEGVLRFVRWAARGAADVEAGRYFATDRPVANPERNLREGN